LGTGSVHECPAPCSSLRAMATDAADAWFGEDVPDAHCHPHLDAANFDALSTLGCRPVALMSVARGDWPAVQAAASALGPQAIECFGIHPWWSHLHGTRACPDKASLFEAKTPALLGQAAPVLDALPDPVPRAVWEPELRELLSEHPRACVGEVGLDRAAVIPGTRVHVAAVHQQELQDLMFELAGEYQRPISVHNVRAIGQIEALLRGLRGEHVPPRVMLHSYGGSVEMVGRFLALPCGDRIYFSFNTAVKTNPEALRERIRAVPDDRLLVESDVTTISRLEPALKNICKVVAEAKGWDVDAAVRQLRANFDRFYEPCLLREEGA